MSSEFILTPPGYLVFDHDGTLVDTKRHPYQLFVGMKEFIRELKYKGFILFVWTARPRQSAVEILRKLEVINYFEDIYGLDSGLAKPDPEGLINLTSGIDKDKVLHIGDSNTDIDGAQAYGIEVIRACWNDPFTLDKFQSIANYTALNLGECRDIIKGKFHV